MGSRAGVHLLLVLCLALVSACTDDEPMDALVQVPAWFPPMEVPAENGLTPARIALGRKLFYDPLLSADSTVSCASCHLQPMAFTDGRQVGVGSFGRTGFRNAPSLANVAYVPRLNADGGIATLELQAQAPIFAHDEMAFAIAGFLVRIANDATYAAMFQAAYGRAPDAFGISRGLAAFERTMISGSSRFDRYEYQGDATALSEAEVRGRQLFFSSRTDCSACHTPPLFTTFDHTNIGLYAAYADSGRARITLLPSDNGKFRIPGLRNIALTAPYMHNGSMASLQQVVAHFNTGGVAHANKDARIRPLGLSAQEQSDLVAFLQALTDEAFVTDPDLARP